MAALSRMGLKRFVQKDELVWCHSYAPPLKLSINHDVKGSYGFHNHFMQTILHRNTLFPWYFFKNIKSHGLFNLAAWVQATYINVKLKNLTSMVN